MAGHVEGRLCGGLLRLQSIFILPVFCLSIGSHMAANGSCLVKSGGMDHAGLHVTNLMMTQCIKSQQLAKLHPGPNMSKLVQC